MSWGAMFDFLRNLGPTELIVLGVILVVFFGSKKIVELGKTAGETAKELKKAKKELVQTVDELKKDDEEVNDSHV